MDELRWFEEYPDYFQEEREALYQIGFSFNQVLFEEIEEIQFNGTVEIEGEKYTLQIRYPEAFPYFTPDVYCSQFPNTKHRLPFDGKLCLFEDWKENGYISGVEVVERTKEWILGQLNGFNSEQEITGPEPKQYHLKDKGGILLTPKEVFFDWQDNEGTFEFKMNIFSVFETEMTRVYGVLTKISSQSSSSSISNHYNHLLGNLRDFRGKCFNVDETPPYFQTSEEIVVWLEKKGHMNINKKCLKEAKHLKDNGNPFGPWLGIRYMDETEMKGQLTPRFLLISLKHLIPGKPPKRFPFSIFESQAISERDLFKRTKDLQPLQKKHAAIIGVGSIGAYIALELAKAGIDKLTLVDHDTVSAGNVVRHICSLYQVGDFKVNAVSLILKSHNPFVKIVPKVEHWGYTKTGDIAKTLKDVDILICAVGHTPTERYINHLAHKLNLPVIYAYSSFGAWSGRVFRVIPNETGCYDCHIHYKEVGVIPSLTEPQSSDEIYDHGCATPALPGSGIDTNVIANLATRLAIQTMLREHPEAYDSSINDHFVWFSQGKGGHLELFQSRVLSHPKCERCHTDAVVRQ